jgi:DNA replication and repair protein RecF
MAVVTKLTVQNIRSHDNLTIELSPTVTVITGSNGSGKTSLLESLYIGLQGSSFKGSDSEILRHDKPWWSIHIEFENDNSRLIKFDPIRPSGRKQFVIDDKVNYRLLPKYQHPVVLFEPDDLRLLHGSPSRRRQFIDRFICQLNPQYKTALHKYERALRQRNSLLKNRYISNDDIFVWNIALSEYGSYIIEQRIIFIEKLNSQLNDYYNKIANSKDIVSMHYSHTVIGDIKYKLLSEYHANVEKDKITGFTSSGPHRHDVIFKYNYSPALAVASRGEVRSIVLALKFLEVDIIEQITDIKPIILLDDVFSELDEDRQKSLLSPDAQIIITSTNAPSKLKTNTKIIRLSSTGESK